MFRNAAAEIRDSRARGGQAVTTWRTCPRVDEILSFGLVPDAACARYFARERGVLHAVSPAESPEYPPERP